jgi:heme/copper-type cytochrome/quinol oxidase subunit 3
MSEAHAIPRLSNVPKGRTALWILIAGEVVIFGGGVASYLLYRVRFPEWKEMAFITDPWFGAANTLVLLTSSFFVVMAHNAAVKKDVAKVRMFLTLTIVCAFLFLTIKSFEWIPKISHGLGIVGAAWHDVLGNGLNFFTFYYFLTGLHAVHVIIGGTALVIIMLSVGKGKNLHRVEMGGLYWHFVDIVWIFLFPMFYIGK